MDQDNRKEAAQEIPNHLISGYSRDDLSLKAREIVVGYFNKNVRYRRDIRINVEDTYTVWFCKVMENWKALVSTRVTDGQYYEVTYDGSMERYYLDVYVKAENVIVND